MVEPSADGWAAGEAYEAYMGRWSRALARVFVEWLHEEPGGHWLEVGCGTGALTAAIVDVARPASVAACDPSAPFVEHARRTLPAACTFSVMTTPDELPRRDGGFDALVSGLVLNFVPEPATLLAALRERARPGGTVAAYIWDYAGGLELLHCFWEEAVALNPGATSIDESQRFGAWSGRALESLWRAASFVGVRGEVLEIPTVFADFDDYWIPFLGRTGPAPSYVAALGASEREQLRERLERRLTRGRRAPIELRARAFAVRGTAT